MKNLLNHQAYYLANHFANTKLTKNRIQMMIQPKTKSYKKLHFLWIMLSAFVLNACFEPKQETLAKSEVILFRKDNLYGMLNAQRDTILKPRYMKIYSFNYLGYAFVSSGEAHQPKYGVINKKGKEIVPCMYDDFRTGHFPSEKALFIFKKNWKWGVINVQNQIQIPFKYDVLEGFQDGLALARKGSKRGFIDTEGNTIIPFEYGKSNGFYKGKAVCSKHGKYGIINKQNQVLVPFEYEALLPNEGGIDAEKNGKWGVINLQNQVLEKFENDNPRNTIFISENTEE